MMPASPARQKLLRTRLDSLARALPELEAGHRKAVHKTRVAARRLRELLPLLQIDYDAAAKLGRRLRRARRALGRARELDVLYDLSIALRESGRHHPQALRQVEEALHAERDRLRARLPLKAIATELRRIRRKLDGTADAMRPAERQTPDLRWRWALQARITRRASRLKEAMNAAGAVYLSERLHAVRIALKKLRYALELSQEVTRSGSESDLRLLKRQQALLGDLRDRQLLIDHVRAIQARAGISDPATLRDLDELITDLETNCRRMHARYVRKKDALLALCGRLSGRPSSDLAAPARRVG
jgi:CHAD domain-containing protein